MSQDAPIPFTLSPIDRPIPYRLRVCRLSGALDQTIVPHGAPPSPPPERASGPRLREAV
jgi:hypothetical protein